MPDFEIKKVLSALLLFCDERRFLQASKLGFQDLQGAFELFGLAPENLCIRPGGCVVDSNVGDVPLCRRDLGLRPSAFRMHCLAIVLKGLTLVSGISDLGD